MKNTSRLDQLTSLRFFAAFAVFNLHFLAIRNWWPDCPQWLARIVESGDRGVTLFFVLSGFILAHVYADIGQTRGDRRAFWVNRFARIYPVYLLAWLWVGPFFIAHRFDTEPPSVAVQKTLAAAAPSLVLLQSWLSPRFAVAWNGPGWTLSVELLFYLCFPFLLPLLRRLGPATLVGVACSMAAVSGFLTFFSALIFGAESTQAAVVHFNPLFNLPQFACGVALGCLFAQRRIAPRLARVAVLAGSLGCVLAMSQPRDSLLFHFAFMPAAALLIVGLAHDAGPKFLRSKTMVALGEASYSLYLLQFAIAATLDLAGLERGSVAYYAAIMPASICVALITYRLIESPARRYIQSLFASERPEERRGVRNSGPAYSGVGVATERQRR